MNWDNVKNNVDSISFFLKEKGVILNDKIGIYSFNSIEYVEIFLAINRIGACIIPIPYSLNKSQVKLLYESLNLKILFIQLELFKSLDFSLKSLTNTIVVSIDFHKNDFYSYNSIIKEKNSFYYNKLNNFNFNIIFSSGTTGNPKGIIHSHHTRSVQCEYARKYNYNENSKTIISTPLFSNTTIISLLPTLAFGGSIILMKKFNVNEFLELIMKHEPTHAMLVPNQIQRIIDYKGYKKEALNKLKIIRSTSSRLNIETKMYLYKYFHNKFFESYGLTETGAISNYELKKDIKKIDSVGKIINSYSTKIINKDSIEVGKNEVGEIVCKTKFMMDSYYPKKINNNNNFWLDIKNNKYFKTGDLGFIDEDNYLFLKGRIKDVIISGGFNIYPDEIEKIILKNDFIKEVTVLGFDSKIWGETPVAFVKLVTKNDFCKNKYLQIINEQLGKTERISELIILNDLPKNSIGKIDKKILRETYTSHLKK